MDNGPPFDDDELINDFNEEEDFYPEEYDDEIDEFVGTEKTNDSNDANAPLIKPTSIPGSNDIDTQDFAMNMDYNEDMEINQEEPHHNEGNSVHRDVEDVPMQVTVAPTIQKVKKDVYGFEWYNGGHQWRRNNPELDRSRSDVMEAAKWKQKVAVKHALMEDMKKTGDSHGKKRSQEAQLVKFSMDTRRRKSRSSLRSSRFAVCDNFPDINQSSVPVTVDGKLVQVPRIQNDLRYVRTDVSKNLSIDSKSDSLLGINMPELTRRADALARKNERKKRQKLSHDNTEKSDELGKSDTRSSNGVHRAHNDKLWVDKHSPSHFSDLLSDERINREVLRALRQWDPYVFQKQAPPRPVLYQNKLNEEEATNKTNTGDINDVEDKRPNEKNRVILLSGPPGVGEFQIDSVNEKHAHNSHLTLL